MDKQRNNVLRHGRARRLCEGRIAPVVNQIEVNPFCQQTVETCFMQANRIAVEAWGSYAEGRHDFFNNPVLGEIGRKYDKTVAQTALRWLYQRGIVSLVKTVRAERMKENLAVLDFELYGRGHAEDWRARHRNQCTGHQHAGAFRSSGSELRALYHAVQGN